MKMYILILDSVPNGHAINSAAHASLMCYLKFKDSPNMQEWLKSSFKKVTCRVSPQDFATAIGFESEHVIVTESNLEGKTVAAAFPPKAEWDPFFKTLSLWK